MLLSELLNVEIVNVNCQFKKMETQSPSLFITKLKCRENLSDFCIIQSTWNNDIDIQFQILEYSVDSQNIYGEWKGQISMEDLRKSASELHMSFDDYFDECKLVFCTYDSSSTVTSGVFSYHIKNDTFILYKNEKYKCIYIEMNVQHAENLRDRILLDCIDIINTQNNKLKEFQLRHGSLNVDYQTIVQSYQKLVEQKNSLEATLLSKFAMLINSKKNKIAELQQLLSETETRRKLTEEIIDDEQINGKTVSASPETPDDDEDNIDSSVSIYSQPTQKLPKRKQFAEDPDLRGKGNDGNSDENLGKLPKRTATAQIPTTSNAKNNGVSTDVYERDTQDMLNI